MATGIIKQTIFGNSSDYENHNGLIIQRKYIAGQPPKTGQANATTVTWNTAFPNACIFAYIVNYQISFGKRDVLTINDWNKTSVKITQNNEPTAANMNVYIIGIGY